VPLLVPLWTAGRRGLAAARGATKASSQRQQRRRTVQPVHLEAPTVEWHRSQQAAAVLVVLCEMSWPLSPTPFFQAPPAVVSADNAGRAQQKQR